MFDYLNDLEPLEDITDDLYFEEPTNIFDDTNIDEFIETTLHLIDDFMKDNPNVISEPYFEDIVLDEIKELLYLQLEEHILEDDDVEDDIDILIKQAFEIYMSIFHTERSLFNEDINTEILSNEKKNHIIEQIQFLREIPQPEQRTKEWYEFRWNLITASNAWKAFERQNTVNQLIYEKCKPIKELNEPDSIGEEIKVVNTNTTLHWGQKYEPVSVMIYEYLYKSKVEDFGCIPHSIHKFIGASPDGIIIESETGRFGRMLEIKNIVNREITGIPKKEYWIQMQIQMEVCGLDECDFLETKFEEYPDLYQYKQDSFIDNNNNLKINTTKDGKQKGIIIHFYKSNGAPFYVYKPLEIDDENEIQKWEEETIEKYESAPYHYIFIQYIYWRLEKLSCVLVLRNQEWFKTNLPQLQNVWNIIEKERVTGYEHRAPNKKQKKTEQTAIEKQTKNEECLLKFDKIIKIDTEKYVN